MVKNYVFHVLNNENKMKIIKFLIHLIFLNLILSPFVFASDWEYYSEYNFKFNLGNKMYFNLREETRYKNSKNYYRKTFTGLTRDLNRNWCIGFYYAFIQIKIGEWKDKNMVWPDIIYQRKYKFIILKDRSRIEWHITNKFWIYRNQFKIELPITKKVIIWVGDEIRYFFEEDKIGENEAIVGMVMKLNNTFSLNIFYDYRREIIQDNLENTNCLRMVFNFIF